MKKAFLQLHIAVFLAGFTAILGKLILLNEGLLVWWRLLITIVVLAIIMISRGELKAIPGKDFLKIAGVGFLVAFHWVAFYGSIKYANVSVALVCFSATGFFTALFEPLILKKKPVPAEFFFGLMAMAGIYIIFDFHPQYKMGILFGILAAVGSALFPIFNKILLNRFNSRILTIYEFTGGLLSLCLLLPFYFMHFEPAYYLPTASDWGWLLLLSVVCTVVMFDLQLKALRKVSAFTVSLSYNLEPLYGILLAFVIFRENKLLQQQFYFGLGLIMVSILLHTIKVLSDHRNR
ncbi:MAG: DMT family transporter [Ferruginibacter sp.]